MKCPQYPLLSGALHSLTWTATIYLGLVDVNPIALRKTKIVYNFGHSKGIGLIVYNFGLSKGNRVNWSMNYTRHYKSGSSSW